MKHQDSWEKTNELASRGTVIMNVPILRPLNPTSDNSTLITLLLYEEIKETIYIYIYVCVCI